MVSKKTSVFPQEMINLLKTPEAKAQIVYDYVAQEQRARQEGEPITAIDLPTELSELAKTIIGIAFQKKDFISGFSVAKTYGLLDSIISTVQNIKVISPYTNNWAEKNHFTEFAKTLPGYKEPKKYSDGDAFNLNFDLIHQLQTHIVHNVYIPEGKYQQAVGELIRIGYPNDAIAVAAAHLPLDTLPDLCSATNTQFTFAIRKVNESNRPDLEQRLKELHLDAIINGTVRPDLPNYWNGMRDIIFLAKRYGFPPDAVSTIEDRAMNGLITRLTKEIKGWQKNFEEEQYQSDNYRLDVTQRSQHYSNWSDIYHGRFRRALELSSEEREIIEFIRHASKNKIESYTTQVMTTATPYPDKFGLARALQQQEHMYTAGINIIKDKESNNTIRYIQSEVVKILVEEFLPNTDETHRKETMSVLLSNGHSTAAIDAAKTYNLQEWIMGQLVERKNLRSAAIIAEELGDTENAKTYYLQSQMYDNAIALSTDPVEKAAFMLNKTAHSVTCRKGLEYLYSSSDRGSEIENILAATKDIVLDTDKKKIEVYTTAGQELVNAFLNNGEYTKGCLVIEGSKLPLSVFTPVLTINVLENAERHKDYAGCYHIARLRGEQTDSEIYKKLAQDNDQKIYTALTEFLPATIHTVKKPDEYVGSEEDDLPF